MSKLLLIILGFIILLNVIGLVNFGIALHNYSEAVDDYAEAVEEYGRAIDNLTL